LHAEIRCLRKAPNYSSNEKCQREKMVDRDIGIPMAIYMSTGVSFSRCYNCSWQFSS